MSRKAKYIGGARPGVEVSWTDPDTGVPQNAVVEYGHELPADVPVSVRDGLLEQEDNWAEVKRDTGSKGKGE